METTIQQTNGLADMAEAPKKKPEPVVLRSPHDYALVEQSLTHRVEELKKLSKKNVEEGYLREAKAIEADTAAIEALILPQIRNQREFALAAPVSAEKLQKEILGALQPLIMRAFEGLDDPKVKQTKESIKLRRERLARELAERTLLFARDVADASWAHGYHVRTTGPDTVVADKVRTLKGNYA